MLGKPKTSSNTTDENVVAAGATDDAPVIVMAGAPEEDVPF